MAVRRTFNDPVPGGPHSVPLRVRLLPQPV